MDTLHNGCLDKYREKLGKGEWMVVCLVWHVYGRKLDVTNMSLHFNGLGSHTKVFEALGSMLSRNALNPADVSAVSHTHTYTLVMMWFLYSCIAVMLKMRNSLQLNSFIMHSSWVSI